MALRDFIDSNGIAWTAWDIPPARAYQPRRAPARERRVQVVSGYTPERRTGEDRRRRQVPPQLLHGWVCFESDLEKRRLVPPPPEWDRASPAELEALLKQAVSQPKLRFSSEGDTIPISPNGS
jgi:hypothetical protein